MRRYLIVAGMVAVVGLTGCSAGTNAQGKLEHTAITAPAAKARSVVDQQNQQLKQMEQQTGSADPTAAP